MSECCVALSALEPISTMLRATVCPHLLSMCPFKWTHPTLDAASMKHLMTFETSLAFEHLSTLAHKRRGII